jgi:hypothetical protein
MNKYPLSHNKTNEETIMRTILNNSNYPQNTIQRILKSTEKNNTKKMDHFNQLNDNITETFNPIYDTVIADYQA